MSEFGQSGYKFLGMTGNEELVYGLLHLLGTANACFNPILYGYLNENFRNEYKNIYSRMPWYSHSFHRGIPLAEGYPFEGAAPNVVHHLPRDDIERDALRIHHDIKQHHGSDGSDGQSTANKFEKVKRQASTNSATLRDNLISSVTNKSESSDTFSSPDGGTSNSSSSYLQWKPSVNDVTLKSRTLLNVMQCDKICDGLTVKCDQISNSSSCKFVHQAIGQIVTSIESCEERKATFWVSPKHQSSSMETYV